jgi:hypothetical protein
MCAPCAIRGRAVANDGEPSPIDITTGGVAMSDLILHHYGEALVHFPKIGYEIAPM